MVDDAGEAARKTNPARRFFADLTKSLRGGVVGWISAGILGAVIAAGTYYYNRLGDTVDEVRISRTNMNAADALAEARRSVGSRTMWAVPFQNRDDPTQYIAVWHGSADDEPACAREPCLDQLGATKVDLLVGNGGLFEREATPVRAGPDFSIWENLGDQGPAERQNMAATFSGITDWNDDGVREIFSIAVSTGTAPTQYVVLSLFDVRTRKLQQLRMTLSRTTETANFVGDPDPRLRAWLGERFREYVRAQELEACSRTLAGELQCRGQVESDPVTEAADETSTLVAELSDAWIAEHGRDFTSGKLRLQFRPGSIEAPREICFEDGRYRWVNLFKGPLAITDRTANRSAVVYAQDGDHHREIGTIIRGRAYVWLGLASDRHLLAIDPRRWRVERIEVAEWKDGIPDPHEAGGTLEAAETKDVQLDSLTLSGGRLAFAGRPLTLSLDGRAIDPSQEFAGSRGCNSVDGSRWGPGNP